MRDKFRYEKGDIQFAKSQCDLCKYNNPENMNQCIKYPDAKPDDILNTIKKCVFFVLEKNKLKDKDR